MRLALKQNKKFPFSSQITAFALPEAEGISKVGTGMPELKSSPAKSPKYQILASFWAKREEERMKRDDKTIRREDFRTVRREDFRTVRR
jgi:hypothetical protein